MKVLVVTSIYPSNENPVLGTFVRTQVEYLKRAGVTMDLLILRGRNQKLTYLKAPFVLRRRLSDPSIDIVHAHYSYPGIIACTQRKVPVVVSYCGDDILGTINERGKPTYFSKLAVFAARLLSNQADAVVVKSRQMAGRLKRKEVFVIPNEVDFEIFRPAEKKLARAILGLDPNKKYLLFAANPQIPVKRFSLAKSAADELKKRDASIELLTVNEESQDRLALFMNACDALVFTSYQEGSPNIIKQAMACNLPIVSTDVGDVPEIIGGTSGCFVCKPDVSEFSTQLSHILKTGERTHGCERVGHLSGPAVAQRVIEVYERVLENREKHLADRTRRDFYVPAE